MPRQEGVGLQEEVRGMGLYRMEALSVYLNSFEVNSSATMAATFGRNSFSLSHARGDLAHVCSRLAKLKEQRNEHSVVWI